MAIGVGDVVWLNAGQGPYTVTVLSTDAVPNVTMTQGATNGLQTVPVPCLTKKNPNPLINYQQELLKNSYLASGSSTVPSS